MLRNFNPGLSRAPPIRQGDFLMDNWEILLGIVILIAIILWRTGIISFKKTNRLYYGNYFNRTNVADINPLNRIRHSDFSVFGSTGNSDITTAGPLWTRRPGRRRQAYSNMVTQSAEPSITNSNTLTPETNLTPETSIAEPGLSELTGVSSRYTNQKFGDWSVNNSHIYMNPKVGQPSVDAFTPHEMRTTRRTKRTPY
jgi:hypothetical protein